MGTRDGRAALAKDAIAFANYGGGTIVVGVAEVRPGEFVARGIEQSLVADLEASKLNNAVRPFLDPPISLTVKIVRDGARHFALIRVPAAEHVPVIAKRQNERASLYLGRLYTRSSACESAEVQTSAELRTLLDRFRSWPGV
jgi:predicted HTH transcriptional regulator